jgi:hypothetical protein
MKWAVAHFLGFPICVCFYFFALQTKYVVNKPFTRFVFSSDLFESALYAGVFSLKIKWFDLLLFTRGESDRHCREIGNVFVDVSCEIL